MDTIPLLSPDDSQLYRSYIEILQWAVELAWIDLTQSILLKAWFCNAPCECHMVAVSQIFLGYVKGRLNAKVIFDLAYHDWTLREWHNDVD